MVVDTSDLIAILLQESEADRFTVALRDASVRLVSAVSALEASIVIEARKGLSGGRDLNLLLHRANAELVACTAEQFEIARNAYRKYGKGLHPAGLNFGDCCAYALAKVSGEPLLAKGADFPKTDVALVAG